MRRDEAEKWADSVDFTKGNGLVPVIVQDAATDKILTQAFMNREALVETLTSGKMHYWSRTRRRLWMKGEESEHYSLVSNAIMDCDNDSLLFKVQQIGPACHTGKESCFHNPHTPEPERDVDARYLEKVMEIIGERMRNPKKDSYVSTLTQKGDDAILRKIGEESTELILAAKGGGAKDVTGEAADLIFHTLVVLARKGVDLKNVLQELANRHRAKTEKQS